ncbi:VIR protein [Plasmodium vivax]|uniref:VIR protein n=1 Tax=Plasmodium vivax TaxID=5855 RepID=A0A1G4E1Y7_PLAVI|nr:VIR protein [Plasmodium vivax]SCA81994.1 VIR protein [Plasmodium vivax]
MADETYNDSFNNVNLFENNRESYARVTSTPDYTHLGICNNITSKISGDFSFVTTCVKITQYLVHINHEYARQKVNDKCEFLNYLINYNINVIKPGVNDTSTFFNDMISVYKEQMSSKINICLNNMKYINNNVLKDLKILMDLFGNFNKFKKINKEKETDCSIGVKCVESYMSSLVKCKENNNIQFCNILEMFYKYYNEQAPTLDYCKNVQRYLPPVKGYLNAVSYAVIAVFTIPILLSTVFLLYKFTPLQSWIRPQIVEKKKLLKNLQEENFKLQENYKINEADTRNNGFNLPYNAVLN